MKKPVFFREGAGTPVTQPKAQAVAEAPKVSFQKDIMPLFKQFQGPMMWRFDLTDYEAVRANAQTILGRISSTGAPMPPPPFPPLTQEQIKRFSDWIDQGYQP